MTMTVGESSGSTPEAIVTIMSKLLTDLVTRNDQFPLIPSQVTPFHSSTPPAISVKNYLEDRILKYAGCSEETFILALIYMDQEDKSMFILVGVFCNPAQIVSCTNVGRSIQPRLCDLLS